MFATGPAWTLVLNTVLKTGAGDARGRAAAFLAELTLRWPRRSRRITVPPLSAAWLRSQRAEALKHDADP